MTWSIGDHGYQMTLSASVPALIEQHLKEYLAGFLAQHDEEIVSIGVGGSSWWNKNPVGGRKCTFPVGGAIEWFSQHPVGTWQHEFCHDDLHS